MFHGSVRAFDEAARAKSIRQASDVLGVAPSSVSRHVAMLEQQMGTSLFIRRAGGIELTHAGSLVADYVRRILVDYDSLRADLDDLRGTQRRLVRLAVVESIASSGPMSALTNFAERFPGVSFNIRLMPALQVVEAVRQGQCEIGLTYCAEADDHISTLARIPELIMLAVPEGHDLAGSGAVEIRDVVPYPLGLPDKDFVVRRIVDRMSAVEGIRLEPILSSNDFGILRAFVRSGSGISLLPARAILHPDGGGLRAMPLARDGFQTATIDLVVLRERRLPRVLKAFIDELTVEISAAHGRVGVSKDFEAA